MIEVGNLIRINGIIGRVEQIGNSLFWLEDGSSYGLSDKAVKYSKNIIDLIEVGDLINKSGVYELGQSDNGQKWIKVRNGYLYFENDLLKQTILTKEKYMQNCYKCQYIENGTI